MLIRSTLTNYQNNHTRLGRVSAVVSGGWGRGGLGSDTKPQSKNNTVSKYDARKQVFSLKNQASKLLPNHRVCGCCNHRVNKDALVGVKVATHQNNNGVTRKATLTNVFRCDSIWVCPVCSQRILAKRGKEIEQALQMVEYKGGSVFMLTLTHSHQLGEALKPKLKLLGKALTRFFGDRTMQALFAKCGLIGHIKALEFTHSFNNGWHPHNHILMFSSFRDDEFKKMTVPITFDKNGFIQLVTPTRYKMMKKRGQLGSMSHVTIEDFIKHYWRKVCLAVGLGEPSFERGATLQDADKAKSYLTKFKTSQEMVGTSKVAKGSSRNQWQLLQDSLGGDAQASALFAQYAEATHGQRQLVWSRGLKEFFNIEQVEDAQCEDTSDDEVVNEEIAYFQVEQWHFVRKHNLIAELLNLAEMHGMEKLKEYIEKIPITARPVQDDPSLAVMRL
jgi:hypothetical protein